MSHVHKDVVSASDPWKPFGLFLSFLHIWVPRLVACGFDYIPVLFSYADGRWQAGNTTDSVDCVERCRPAVD